MLPEGLFSHNIEDYPEGIILPVDKPYRWTSADVVGKIKWAACRHFGKKNLKVGHAGTLDPLATGLLLVCIGPATRRAEELQRSPKQYVAGVTFGATTASYDLEKEIETDRTGAADGHGNAPDALAEHLRATLSGILQARTGEQMQVAPLFSAKSVDGVRAYEMARSLYRQGMSVEDSGILQANRIEIYGMQLLEFCSGGNALERPEGSTVPARRDSRLYSVPQGPLPDAEASTSRPALKPNPRIHVSDITALDLPTALISIDCSKGTYIRALARDLGEDAGTAALLSSLRRTANGGFDIEDALSLEEALEKFEFQHPATSLRDKDSVNEDRI